MELLKHHNYNAINATIIADSKNEFGNRITTFVVTFPRIILAELNTHRMFSRNSASSRAIPFKTMVKKVQENPFIPIAWQKDHKGMQGNEYVTDKSHLGVIEDDWLQARDFAIKQATRLNTGFADIVGNPDLSNKVTKQLCNRLLEPFMWHTAIITATEYENFFALRCPQYSIPNSIGRVDKRFRSKKDMITSYYENGFNIGIESLSNFNTMDWLKINQGAGEIHIMALAETMWDAMNRSTPKELKEGEWHIPFGEDLLEALESTSDKSKLEILSKEINKTSIAYNEDMEKLAIKIATARCARVSYLNFDGSDDYQKDIELHDNLARMGHWSPFEHCAKAMQEWEYNYNSYNKAVVSKSENGKRDIPAYISNKGWSGNFRGFIQYRKMFDNENIRK
jgi:hypothetical protein